MFCRFLDLGGKEKEGVQILSESYVGLPHVLNVLIEWLHAAGMYCGPACDECMSEVCKWSCGAPIHTCTCQLGPAIMIFMNEFHSLYHVSKHTSVSYFYYYLNGLSHNTTGCPILQWSVVSHIIMVCPILQQAVPYSRLQKERDSGYGGGTSEAANYTALWS